MISWSEIFREISALVISSTIKTLVSRNVCQTRLTVGERFDFKNFTCNHIQNLIENGTGWAEKMITTKGIQYLKLQTQPLDGSAAPRFCWFLAGLRRTQPPIGWVWTTQNYCFFFHAEKKKWYWTAVDYNFCNIDSTAVVIIFSAHPVQWFDILILMMKFCDYQF